jgi:ornithine cyclodeaminase
MHKVIQLDDEYINENTIFSGLILELKRGFATQSIMDPKHHHHDFPSPEVGSDYKLLLMPTRNHGIEVVVGIVSFKP